MKLRTRLAYISAVYWGYILLSTEDYAMRFENTDAVRAFLRDHAAILPFGVELVT